MSVPGIQEIQALALKYSKPQLASMAQSGLIDTQKAVLAAMMRDRISKEDAKPPTTTVAQDVMGLQPPQMAQPAPQMAQTALQARPQMGAPAAPVPETPVEMAATGGLTSIPIESQDYAGGGIVAFAKGGDTPYKVYEYTPKFMEETPISTFDLEKQRQLDMQRAFGIDPEFYKKRGEEVGLEREKLAKEKSGSLADALIAGGLGVAAGSSPYALQNIATGATKGFETYQGQMKDIRERDKALIESQNRIKEAEYLRTIGQGEAADKAIQESRKLNREAKNMNIGIQNEVSKEISKAKTEAGKTQYQEKQATGRTAMSTASAERIAKMPPAELRMVQALNDEAVKKATAEGKPAPTLMETYEAMNLAKLKAYGGGDPATLFQKYSMDWNDMPITVRMKYEEMSPPITTAAEYAAHMMKQTPQKKGGANPPPAGGSQRSSVQSQADAIIFGGS
jgi:hypothetical protein